MPLHILPQKALHENGAQVTSIAGFRNQDLVILEKEFQDVSDAYYLVSDDGSTGEKGLVTDVLKKLIENGEQFDEVIGDWTAYHDEVCMSADKTI